MDLAPYIITVVALAALLVVALNSKAPGPEPSGARSADRQTYMDSISPTAKAQTYEHEKLIRLERELVIAREATEGASAEKLADRRIYEARSKAIAVERDLARRQLAQVRTALGTIDTQLSKSGHAPDSPHRLALRTVVDSIPAEADPWS